jgi:hypothetical protein
MSDGSVYEGNFENDKREGWGKLMSVNEDEDINDEQGTNIIETYEGSWHNDMPDETSIANPYLLK